MNFVNTLIDQFNDKSAENSFNSADVQKNNIITAVAYIVPILFFLPIVIGGKNNYCRFHANQQLIWLIFVIALGVVVKIISFIPILGGIISFVAGLAALAIAIVFAIGAYKGKAMRFPFIGSVIDVF